ncbi:MAG: STAS domain-containing protein, partial [Candidatus Delongbacteria bacterium]|nr:STAS domain-containing protein [Candidatus Delongbacteria bacterium]
MALSIEVKHSPSVCQIMAVGRIDGMSSLDIEQTFNSLTGAGERQILVDFTEVKYISSAGLRVFLAAQKKLMAVGGQILLYNLAPSV